MLGTGKINIENCNREGVQIMNDGKKKMHIVSFDVPYPPDYGGVIDVYYKIKALSEAGIEIILHCFHYGRKESERLSELCSEIYYYKRKTGVFSQFSLTPYIVASRRSKHLIHRLLKDDYPVLSEGIHSTGFWNDSRFKGRKLFCRMANVEHDYYRHLYRGERNPIKKLFFYIESKRLKRHESILKKANGIIAISPADEKYFKDKFGKENVNGIYAFHSADRVETLEGKGKYILYHGRLDVPENYLAAMRIIKFYKDDFQFPLFIAGLHPPPFLVEEINKHPKIELISSPDDKRMKQLIRDAHAHLLITDQPTGLKLKLLAALYFGRFVITNEKMVCGTGLETLCIVGENETELLEILDAIHKKTMTNDEITKRRSVLRRFFSNDVNVKKLINIIFELE